MTKLTQKEAVFAAVTAYLEEQDKTYRDDAAVELDREDRKTIIGMLSASMQEDGIELSEQKASKMTEEKDYRDYASNILNNWTRKDTRLNGGETYTPKNPGSRQGAGDQQIKELKNLLKLHPEQHAAIELAIDKRLSELAIERNKSKIAKVNFDLIPEFAHLKTSK